MSVVKRRISGVVQALWTGAEAGPRYDSVY